MPRTAFALARLVAPSDPAPPDAPLLRAFATGGQAVGAAAFEELVRRHGPMVLAACRRVLGDPDDAEDAFQAVFLVLARKAVAVRGNLAAWLYAVAVRTARGVRLMRDRRRKHEAIAANGRRDQGEGPTADPDLAAVIDEELARLPGHYRDALVLCELRGLSRRTAAAELGVPEGTVASRVAGAKRRLAARLSKRGLSASAALAPLLAPAALSAGLVRAAVAVTHGTAGAVASAAAGAVVKGMLFDQLKAVVLAAGVLLTTVCGGLAMTGTPGGSDPATVPAPRQAVDPLAKLVGQLGAPEFADREEAAKKLRDLGKKAEAALKYALRSEDPEVRTRAASVLNAIRKDIRDALAKSFRSDGADEPDHPVWKRFSAVVGSDAAARKLFAEIIADPRYFRLLDDAERDPDRAGDLYAAEIDRAYVAIQKILDLPVTGTPGPDIVPWPALPAILYLGTYPSSSGKVKDGWAREGHVFLADNRGQWDKEPTAAAMKRLFAAWLLRRDHPKTLERGLEIAVASSIESLLPLARKVTADAKKPVKLRLAALAAVAQFGAPADVPLFKALFADETPVATFPEKRTGPLPAGATGTVTTQARDAAAGMALLLHGDDPYTLGFWHASGRWQKFGDRPYLTRYELTHFGFYDGVDRLRAAAHEKVRAFLDKQPKPEKKEEPKPDPAMVKLVEQLGSPEFADREAAQKELRDLGAKSRAALEAGLKSESAEVVRRCGELLGYLARAEFEARHWERFAKIVGDDKASRELFERIRSLRRNVELLDAVAADPASAGKLYHDRWKELNEAARTPNGPGSYTLAAAPLVDVIGWMYLGTFEGAEGSFQRSYSLDFLPTSFHGTSRDPLPVALRDKTASAALGRLVGKWAAARTDYTGREFGLKLALAFDIAEVHSAARATLGTEVKDDPYPGNTARNVGWAMLVVSKLGSKDDLPLLARFAKDETQCAVFLHDPPTKPGEPVFRIIRPPKEGQDTTTQLRDVSAAMRLHLLGQQPDEFGFYWNWPFGKDAGKPNKLGTFSLYAIGFLRAADREVAHKKAQKWFDAQPGPKMKE